MHADRIFGLFMMVLALGYILSAMGIQTSFMSDPVGPRVFPYLVAGVVMLCSLSLILRPDPNADWPRGVMLAKMAFSVVLLVAYALMIRPLGFILPTVIVAGLLSYQINPRPVPAALSGLGLGIGLYVLFKVILGLGLKGLPPALMG
ncbi:MAG: tripartite tricarboxylate transporter TctB family protein [Rhodobacteraceae bacterium]|jgi:putative tricarboxylic transport membrane protein|nr:tripartite tricarboxylate transporter TctB family protein [Paracoccaceae bacterium]MCF8514429.1 tripartite tricarboxylate transporter TctB family protein [Paracoccaceae bacterium]MCF8518673.1 tripartite tricarboxylate transporter TctB family protein [Paracoccaceae bacterium]